MSFSLSWLAHPPARAAWPWQNSAVPGPQTPLPESPEFILSGGQDLVSPGPGVASAVPYPDIVASICEDEAQAAVGQVGDPAAAFCKETVLQECRGSDTCKTGSTMTIFVFNAVCHLLRSSWSAVPMAAKIRGGLCRSSSRFHLKSRFAKLHRYPGLYPQNLLAEHGLPGSSVRKQGGAWACDRKKAIFMDLTSSPTTPPRTRGFPWRPNQSADPSNGCRSTFWEPGSGTPQGIPPGWI